MGKHSGSHEGSWLRVVRPLFWWLLLVLVLFGIRTHERLMEQTSLNYTVTLAGQPLVAEATLDRESFQSGQNISLGDHKFVVGTYKTETFSTNFFAWYGPHDFGEIKLKRSFGTLNVQANPPAPEISISGPEFSTTLIGCTDTNLVVPTDVYAVFAQYPHWSKLQNITVNDNQSVSCNFAPQFGAVHLTCNKDGAMYLLQTTDQAFTGDLPAVLTDLPVGNYPLTVAYHQRDIKESAAVEADVTNELPFKFVLGAARIESSPPGASVTTTNGRYLGATPLDLLDVPPQTAHLNLSLFGYEPVSVTLDITADQTNFCRTNLISASYQSEMQDARTSLAEGNYSQVLQFTREVLNTMPNDADAQALQSEASQHLAAENDAQRQRQEQLKRPREVFDEMCRQNADASLFAGHELKTEKAAKDVAAAIAKSLSSESRPFELLQNDSPKPDVYGITARQTFSLGILGGTERICLLVVGQTKPDETQIVFKVLEYQIKTTITAGSLFSGNENKQLIPVSPDRIQMTDVLQTQLRQGVQIVSERIQKAIGEVQ